MTSWARFAKIESTVSGRKPPGLHVYYGSFAAEVGMDATTPSSSDPRELPTRSGRGATESDSTRHCSSNLSGTRGRRWAFLEKRNLVDQTRDAVRRCPARLVLHRRRTHNQWRIGRTRRERTSVASTGRGDLPAAACPKRKSRDLIPNTHDSEEDGGKTQSC